MYQLSRVSATAIFLVMYSISCFSHTITAFSQTGDQSLSSENYFIVTAYYSPLPNQEYYMTSSYDSDVRLNGAGIHGASGKEVFPGMIAAPKKYDFGTKIYIEGLGTGSVEDRGGAIVEASDGGPNHDRLDVWMGYGDAGRTRAITWGARKVRGYVVPIESEITINFSSHITAQFFGKTIGPESSQADIKMLQELLSTLQLYTGSIDGKHDSVKNTLISYQLENSIISGESDSAAGYFGVKTIEALKQDFPNAKSSQTPPVQKVTEKQKISKISIPQKTISDISGKDDIKILQTILKRIGLYKGKIDGRYDEVRHILITYQIKKKILSKATDFGAGNFGPKTREALKKEYVKILNGNETQSIDSVQTISIPTKNIAPDSSKELIKQLQTSMKGLNLYDGKIDGDYTSIKKSLIQYQLKRKIIKKDTDESAGYYGPKTRDYLQQEVREIARK